MFNLEKDVDNALLHYPLLKKVKTDAVIGIKGRVEINRPDGTVIDFFEIEIYQLAKLPYAFPKVIETSGKIPHELDRHINIADNYSLCLAVRQEEKLICTKGISTLFFLNNVVYQHLARELFVNAGEAYPDGEYGHGDDGAWEFYAKHFTNNDKDFILNVIELIVKNMLPGRNDDCFCGKKMKYKKCHENGVNFVSSLGTDYLRNELKILTK